jgi:NADH-quinone oxidoreductase subunit M
MAAYLIIIPLIFSLIGFIWTGKPMKMIALIGSLAMLVFSGYLISNMAFDGSAEFTYSWLWMPEYGVNVSGGLDGLNILLILLSSVVLPVIVINTMNKPYAEHTRLYGMLFLMVAAMNGVFIAMDGLSFYIFWEMALLPIYFICALWGDKGQLRSTFKFFIYTFVGSLMMLAALIYLYLQTPGIHSFDFAALMQVNLSITEAIWVALGFFVGFAVKIPIFPLHSWQPDTYTYAPATGTLLLSGIMLKMGTYGAMRWLVGLSPEGMEQLKMILITLAVIGVVFGSLIAITQRDIKRVFAWSSMAHVNLIAAGIFTMSEAGWQGALIQMFNHGVNIIGLFIVADIIESRLGTRDLKEMGGIALKAPNYAILAFILLLGSIGLPLTNGFVGEFLLIKSIFVYNNFLGFLACTTVILSAVYMFRMFQLAMFGNPTAETNHFNDVNPREFLSLGILCFFVIVVGILPQSFLDMSLKSVQTLLGLLH